MKISSAATHVEPLYCVFFLFMLTQDTQVILKNTVALIFGVDLYSRKCYKPVLVCLVLCVLLVEVQGKRTLGELPSIDSQLMNIGVVFGCEFFSCRRCRLSLTPEFARGIFLGVTPLKIPN